MVTGSPDKQIGSLRAWGIWILAALAFSYAFFQRVAPSVMVEELMVDFTIGATVLGTLSALYFYPYFLLQIPLGVLIERWGPRILLSCALYLAGIGSILLATTSSLEIAYFGRFLIGTGSAVGFLGALAIAANWFPRNQFAMLAGMGMFFGLMSGVLAQGPLAAFVSQYGWRAAIWGLGLVGIILGIIIYLFVRDMPNPDEKRQGRVTSWADMRSQLRRAFSSRVVWKVSFVALSMTGPMLTIGGLWGVPYLTITYGLDKTSAATATSCMLVSWALCAPFSGWLSDRIHRRKALLVAASLVLLVAMVCLVFLPTPPLWFTLLLFILIGGSGAFMAITFSLVRETCPSGIDSSATSIVNSFTVASGAFLQPAVGYVLDRIWGGKIVDGAPVYLASDFRAGFFLILLSCLSGFLVCLCLKETPVWKTNSDNSNSS